MPLMKSKSKEAFSHNVGAEMDAGKPQKQALAIAYSVKRKGRKMAKGGMVESETSEVNQPEAYEDDEYAPDNEAFLSDEGDREYEPLEASMDNEEGHEEPDQQKEDIVASILRSIRMKHMGSK